MTEPELRLVDQTLAQVPAPPNFPESPKDEATGPATLRKAIPKAQRWKALG